MQIDWPKKFTCHNVDNINDAKGIKCLRDVGDVDDIGDVDYNNKFKNNIFLAQKITCCNVDDNFYWTCYMFFFNVVLGSDLLDIT